MTRGDSQFVSLRRRPTEEFDDRGRQRLSVLRTDDPSGVSYDFRGISDIRHDTWDFRGHRLPKHIGKSFSEGRR